MKRTVRQMFSMASLVGILILAPWIEVSAQTAADKANIIELHQKVAKLEARLQAMESAVQVSGGNVKIMSQTGLTLQGSVVTIRGAGTVDIKGGVLMLNGATKPLARVGDRVSVPLSSGPVMGTIIEGSTTILVQ